MKNITVEYGNDGRILSATDTAVYFEQENASLQIDAKISTDKKVRAYIKASNGNSDVTDALTPASTTIYSVVIGDKFMSKGTLYVGFEVYDDDGYVERFDPVKVYIDSFVNPDGGNTDNVYVVTAQVGQVVTLSADEPAYVKNVGTKKDLLFEFGIPRGPQGVAGPKGDAGAKGEKGDIGDKGDKGDKGADGKDGYTPVKGKDYYTDEETAQIRKDAAAAAREGLDLSKYKRNGAVFTLDGKSYILMDEKLAYNGKTYYPIMRAKNLASGLWSYTVDGIYLKNPDTATDGKEYVSLYKGYATDVQILREEHFGSFGDYVVGEDYEWSFGKNNNGRAIIVKGSVGIPTYNQLMSASKIDKQTHNKYSRTITRSTMTYNGKVYVDFFDDAPTDRGILNFDEAQNAYVLAHDVNTTDWYVMTYVCEDFFKNTHLDLYEAGECVKWIIKRDFAYTDLAGVYNPGELNMTLGMSEAVSDV